jgi:hypothetical protein
MSIVLVLRNRDILGEDRTELTSNETSYPVLQSSLNLWAKTEPDLLKFLSLLRMITERDIQSYEYIPIPCQETVAYSMLGL